MDKSQKNKKRSLRTRYKLKRVNKAMRLRLSVFRSCKHISAQIIDDQKSLTIVSASSHAKDILAKKATKTEKAKLVGEIIAKKASEAGITQVVFDRGSCPFHGRVKELAIAVQASGIKF